jgi:hypothetical protein
MRCLDEGMKMNLSIVPSRPTEPDFDAMVLSYWLMYCRTPGKLTAPGETVDLGEVGEVPEKNFERWSPYSLAKPSVLK